MLGATRTADLVHLPARTVLSLDGAGPVDGPGFRGAADALLWLARAMNRARTLAGRAPFRIGPLEARWWIDRHAPPLLRGLWLWRLRVAVPDDVRDAELAAAVVASAGRSHPRGTSDGQARRVVIEHLPGGIYGRVLYAGPRVDDPVSLDRIRGALARERFGSASDHIEVYLRDPRRSSSEAAERVLLLEAVREPHARAA
jgi:hypothetical protein